MNVGGQNSGPQRALWLVVGVLALILGAIGAVLPLLPTTPFLLVAAFAFARSSPRLHDWLVNHPRLGPPIDHWRRHGAISRRSKILAGVMMAAALGLSIATGVKTWIIVVQVIVLGGAAAFVFSRPGAPDSDA